MCVSCNVALNVAESPQAVPPARVHPHARRPGPDEGADQGPPGRRVRRGRARQARRARASGSRPTSCRSPWCSRSSPRSRSCCRAGGAGRRRAGASRARAGRASPTPSCSGSTTTCAAPTDERRSTPPSSRPSPPASSRSSPPACCRSCPATSARSPACRSSTCRRATAGRMLKILGPAIIFCLLVHGGLRRARHGRHRPGLDAARPPRPARTRSPAR